MSEEVLIKLGVDGSQIKTGLRGVMGSFDELRSKIGGGIGGLFAGLSAGAIVGWSQEMAKLSKEIKTNAEVTGTSTQYIQLWAVNAKRAGIDADTAEKAIEKLAINIGKAKEEGSESSKVFDRYGIALKSANGQANSTQQIIGQIADKMKDTEDPTVRAAMAVELFGKSSIHMADALHRGSEELGKFMKSRSALAFSDTELQTASGLRVAGGAAARLGNRAGLLAATALMPWATVLGQIRSMDSWGKSSADAGADGPSKEELKALEESKKRLAAIEEQDRTTGMSHAGKLNLLLEHRVKLQSELESMAMGEMNATQLATAQNEKRIEIAELTKSIHGEITAIEKDRYTKSEEAHKAEKEHTEKMLELRKEIAKSAEQVRYEAQHMSEARLAPYQMTVDELAKGGTWRSGGTWGRGGLIQNWAQRDASEIERLTEDARNSYLNPGRRDADIQRIDFLRKALEDAGIISPERSMEKMAESLEVSKASLAELVQKFSNGSATVQVREGE